MKQLPHLSSQRNNNGRFEEQVNSSSNVPERKKNFLSFARKFSLNSPGGILPSRAQKQTVQRQVG